MYMWLGRCTSAQGLVYRTSQIRLSVLSSVRAVPVVRSAISVMTGWSVMLFTMCAALVGRGTVRGCVKKHKAELNRCRDSAVGTTWRLRAAFSHMFPSSSGWPG